MDIIVGPTPGWPIRIPRLEIYLQQTDFAARNSDRRTCQPAGWLVAELDPLLVPGISRGAVSLLDGVSRYELRELATACITEEKLLALLFELNMDQEFGWWNSSNASCQFASLPETRRRAPSSHRFSGGELQTLRGTSPGGSTGHTTMGHSANRTNPEAARRQPSYYRRSDAFCLDHFRDVYQLFQSSMCRLRRTNLLLSAVDPRMY